LKILHVIHGYAPVIGGSEILVQKVAEGLAAQGHESHVFTTTARSASDFLRPQDEGLSIGTEVMNGVTVRRFRFRRVPGRWRRFVDERARLWWEGRWPGYGRVKAAWIGPHLPGLGRAIRALRPDLIVVATAPFQHIYDGQAAGARAGIPVIVMPCLHPSDRWLLDNPHLHALLRRADGVMVLTPYEGLLVRSLGVAKERIHRLGGGVDEDAGHRLYTQGLRERFGIAAGEPLVLFMGRKEEKKGIRAVTEAMLRSWQAGRRATLVLAGASTEYSRQELRPWLASLPPEDRARIVSRDDIDEAEKWGWYAECDLMAQPSSVESFGLVYLEAWLMGKPVVAARNGPVSSLVTQGEDGLLVGDGQVDELVQAFAQLLDDPARAQAMGAAGRRKVLGDFTWPRIVERAAALYQTVVRRHHEPISA
jgi:glycosyltransferase involved in cell wall biosynthesis